MNNQSNLSSGKFIFFAPDDVLKGRVDPLCNVRLCEAMKELGYDVEMVSLRIRRSNAIEVDKLWEHYGVSTPFQFTFLYTPLSENSSRLSLAAIRALLYSLWVIGRLFQREPRKHSAYCLYFKNYAIGFVFCGLRALLRVPMKLVMELHILPQPGLSRRLLKCVDKVVVLSQTQRQDMIAQGFKPEKITVAPQGAPKSLVDRKRLSKKSARQKLGLPVDCGIVAYTGKVALDYAEIELLIETASFLKTSIKMLIVGGKPQVSAELARRARAKGILNVIFESFVPPSDICYYQMAADALVLYYPKSGIPTLDYMSPGKLFDYLAAGRPIVAAEFPVLKEILNTPFSAIFVRPEDPRALAAELNRLIDNDELQLKMCAESTRLAEYYTWERRATVVAKSIFGSDVRSAPVTK